MTQIILKIKDDKKGKALLDFLKKMDFIEVEESKKIKPLKNQEIFQYAGIWKDRQITKKSLRKLAWKL